MAISKFDELIDTRPTITDLSSSAYCVVSLSSAGNAAILTGATPWHGVLTDQVALGTSTAPKEVGIQVGGFAAVKAGGTIAVGDKLRATTDGKVIATTTTGHYYGAVALSAGVSGDILTCNLFQNGLVA